MHVPLWVGVAVCRAMGPRPEDRPESCVSRSSVDPCRRPQEWPVPSPGQGGPMLRDHPIHATIPANDLERARAFYHVPSMLTCSGSPQLVRNPAGLIYETPDGPWFRLYRTPYAGTARPTLAGWEVEDLEAEVAPLKARGVDLTPEIVQTRTNNRSPVTGRRHFPTLRRGSPERPSCALKHATTTGAVPPPTDHYQPDKHACCRGPIRGSTCWIRSSRTRVAAAQANKAVERSTLGRRGGDANGATHNGFGGTTSGVRTASAPTPRRAAREWGTHEKANAPAPGRCRCRRARRSDHHAGR